jgi:hypothetical protein
MQEQERAHLSDKQRRLMKLVSTHTHARVERERERDRDIRSEMEREERKEEKERERDWGKKGGRREKEGGRAQHAPNK